MASELSGVQPFSGDSDHGMAPTAFSEFQEDYGSGEPPRFVYELAIMDIGAMLRNKPEWWRKVQDPTIVAKWKSELNARDEDDDEEQDDATRLLDEQVVEYAIAETLWLAQQYENNPVRPAGTDSVFARHDLATDLQKRLLDGVAQLRGQPAIGATAEDRHPGTPHMVDLVHPSLYCYERTKTHVLPNKGAETLVAPPWDDVLGKDGEPEDSSSPDNPKKRRYCDKWRSPVGLQWLPSEFVVQEEEKMLGGETKQVLTCKINSYINNLHPKEYSNLYEDLGQLFAHAVPLLEETLAEVSGTRQDSGGHVRSRIVQPRITSHCNWWKEPSADDAPPEMKEDHPDYDEDEYMEWVEENKTFLPPPIPEFQGPRVYNFPKTSVSLRNRPLQVIVKIASLELPPGESYEGGTWHVEGTMEERIVATVCTYLENDNVEGGNLNFRTAVHEPEYEQGDYRGVDLMYNLADEQPLLQPRGFCETSQTGTMLAWPNTLQHQVGPVTLKDSTKPGKRTICCFFLVDPALRVRSTATVPPQQLAWVQKAVQPTLDSVLLSEKGVQQQVLKNLTHGAHLMTYEQACKRRTRLMAERRAVLDQTDSKFFERPFSLCEH